jgi:hypothetical protein
MEIHFFKMCQIRQKHENRPPFPFERHNVFQQTNPVTFCPCSISTNWALQRRKKVKTEWDACELVFVTIFVRWRLRAKVVISLTRCISMSFDSFSELFTEYWSTNMGTLCFGANFVLESICCGSWECWIFNSSKIEKIILFQILTN